MNCNLRLLRLVKIFSKCQLFRIIWNDRLRKSDGTEETVQTQMGFVLPTNGKDSAPLTCCRVDDCKLVPFKGCAWTMPDIAIKFPAQPGVPQLVLGRSDPPTANDVRVVMNGTLTCCFQGPLCDVDTAPPTPRKLFRSDKGISP